MEHRPPPGCRAGRRGRILDHVAAGAVGAIERTSAPFHSWLRESLLTLPVFVLAVLVALEFARRRFGSTLHRAGTVAVTLALVAAAGTVAGLGLLVANAAYDYHLQSIQLREMGTMGGKCLGECLAQQQQATLDLQVHAVLFGAALLLVTNLLLVAWVAALRGRRVQLSPTRDRVQGHGATPRFTVQQTRSNDLRLLAAAACVASAVVHAAVVPEHLTEWGAPGAFFVLLAAAELGTAVLVLLRRSRLAWLAAAAVAAAPLPLWLFSRVVGMPFGPEPWTPEPIGLTDTMATLLELLALVVSLAALRSTDRVRRPALSTHTRRLLVLAVLTLTAAGLAGTQLAWFDSLGTGGTMSACDT